MFEPKWTKEADAQYKELKAKAEESLAARKAKKKTKSSKAEGLFKLQKTIKLVREDPRHPSLQTHEYHSLPHPYQKDGKVFAAYAQNRTPGAYRVFWCYGPNSGEITIIAIIPHP